MPDNNTEVLGQPAPPSLSQETIDYQQGLLADPAFVRDHPEHAAMLRRTLDEAKAATGWQGPEADQRSQAERLHAQRFGLSFTPTGDVALPEHLNASMQRDASGNAPDPKMVAAQLAAAGLDPDVVHADAKFALEQTRSTVPLERLSVHALANLALFGNHLRKHQASRPRA